MITAYRTVVSFLLLLILSAASTANPIPPAGQNNNYNESTGTHAINRHSSDGGTIPFDTLFSEELTPGVVHTRYFTAGPNVMDVIAVDLDAPWLHFETYRPDSLTRTTAQSQAVDSPGYRVLAAVNGDFFSFDTHWPIANQMVRGAFVHGAPTRNRYHFAVDAIGRPYLDALSFKGSLILADGTSHPVYGINHTSADADIIAFTRFYGPATPSGTEVLELVLEPANSGHAGEKTPGDDTKLIGSGVDRAMTVRDMHGSGGNTIPADGYVVRVQNPEAAMELMQNLSSGDAVTLRAGFDPGRHGLVDVMGGGVRILDQGRPYSGTNEARHPRTFVAIDRDTTTVFMCTVDGRQLTSIGMSYREMAGVLLQLGAWDAVNLDGGGSTTMVIRDEVANSPSDPGGERRVANALMLISTAPEGDLRSLVIEPDSIELYPHESQKLRVRAFDEFRNPVPLPADLEWEFDPVLGRLDDEVFTPGQTDTNAILSARSGDVAAEAHVRVHYYTSMTSRPPELHLAPGESETITLTGTAPNGEQRHIPVSRTRFEQPDDAVYLSDSGRAFATGYGSSVLYLDAGSTSTAIPFTVSSDVVTEVLFDFSDGISGWATPSQTHRSQILGVDPEQSTLEQMEESGVWTFVDDPESHEGRDIRITRHLRQELGGQLYGSHVGAWVKADDALEIRLVIRDGDGQLEAGPPVRLTPGKWQLVQTRLSNAQFEGYLNGDGKLTREGNQINGFRITGSCMQQKNATFQLKIDRILASPFPLE